MNNKCFADGCTNEAITEFCPECLANGGMKPINKKPKGIRVNILFDDNQILKLRAIAKHTEALANELDAIDAAKCPNCGGPLDITELSIDYKIVDTSAYCRNCRD